MKRGQEYTEEWYKKILHDPDNHDGVITHLCLAGLSGTQFCMPQKSSMLNSRHLTRRSCAKLNVTPCLHKDEAREMVSREGCLRYTTLSSLSEILKYTPGSHRIAEELCPRPCLEGFLLKKLNFILLQYLFRLF